MVYGNACNKENIHMYGKKELPRKEQYLARFLNSAVTVTILFFFCQSNFPK